MNKAAKSQQLLEKKFKATLSPSYSSKMWVNNAMASAL
jgi:hypothetical protein